MKNLHQQIVFLQTRQILYLYAIAYCVKALSVKENAATGESGWMLSGMIAGGMTVWSDDRWPQYYLGTLSNPYSEPANYDPASAKYIQKIATNDLQQGTVGMLLSRPLQVKVMDQAWHPVPNVNVTFTVKAGGGRFSDGSTVKAAQTNAQGIAAVLFMPGKYTKDNPVFWWYNNHLTQPYPEQVGENLVDAYITSTRAPITTPFAVYGFPKTDKPYVIKKLYGEGLANSILFLSGFVSLMAEDEYGNPKSNIPLNFKVKDAEIDPTPPNCDNPAYNQSAKKAYFIRLSEACVFQAPVWGTCGNTQEQELTLPSNHLGAQLEVMLGGVPDAKYQIEAACSPSAACRYYEYTCPQGQPCDYLDNGKPMITYTHYTDYHCGEISLYLEPFYIADAYGSLKNAQKVVDPPAEPLTIPVMAKLFAVTNGDIVTNLENASATFNDIAGASVQNNGTYTANVPITKVGVNQIKVEGKATISGTPKSAGPFYLPVYGVKINTGPMPLLVTDEQGYAIQDTEIKYTILPTAPDPYPYSALSAAVHIFKTDDNGNDVLIEAVRAETTGAGKATIGRGFKFDLGRTYKVQVVLNYGTGIEMRGDLITLRYGDLYIEKVDPEFPTIKLWWDDYYPALESKTITLKSGSNILNGMTVTCEVLEPTANTLANIESMTMPTCMSDNPQIANGAVKFKLTGSNLATMVNNDPATGINDIKLRFTVAQNTTVPGIEATYHVKNNTNTTFQDVLNGEAVFTADRDAVISTSTGTTLNTLGFDYVQELLNQVVPRIRQTYDDNTQQWVTNQYRLIDKNGVYSAPSYTAVMLLKRSFGLSADASDTYRKIKKDYGLNATDADNQWWFYKIIEKEALVGKTQRIPAGTEAITATNADTVPNSNPDNTTEDTGLYELYKNVVERFVNQMISEGDRYRQARGSNYPQANTSWTSRTGETVAESESYCFGCKNTYEQFWRAVTRCAPPAQGQVNAAYAGNVNDSGCGLTGSKRYPGLYQVELNSAQQYYAFDYWTGIDCAGFVQRTAMAGKSLSLPGVTCSIPDLKDTDYNPINHLDDGGILAQAFFTDTPRVSYWTNPDEAANQVILQGKLKKGDLVRYGNTHISMIYSDAPTCDNTSCVYDILHASGNKRICYGLPGEPETCTAFNRKVTTNDINSRVKGLLKNPTGFGRIKLWD